jgi:hypothetical protein
MRENLQDFLHFSKQALKELLWCFTSYRQGQKKNICLFSTRRSGSTWLMELIACNRGVTYSDQPFSIYNAWPKQLKYLPVCEGGDLIILQSDDGARICRYLDELFAGRLQVNGPWRFWTREFDFYAQRIVLKIVSAKALIDFIDKNFDVKILYLTRHPIPTALSIIGNNWGLTAHGYLQNETFASQYLDGHLLRYANDILKTGSLLQKHVLNWTLENLVPLKLLPQRPHWLHIAYEDLTMNPVTVLAKLVNHLELNEIDKMQKLITKPSKSTKKLSSHQVRKQIKTGDTRNIIGRWKEEVDLTDQSRAFDILEKFEISMYLETDSPSSLQFGESY